MRTAPWPIGNGEQRSSSISSRSSAMHVAATSRIASSCPISWRMRFRFGEPAVHRARALALPRRQRAAFDDLQHVGERPRSGAFEMLVIAGIAIVRVRVVVVLMIVIVLVVMMTMLVVAVLAGGDEARVRRGDAALDDPPRFERPAPGYDAAQRAFERVAVEPGVQERRQQHVAGGAADHVDVRDPRARATAHVAQTILCASAAAPKPLSMFTTPIPGAHDVSMPSSAAIPSNAAP